MFSQIPIKAIIYFLILSAIVAACYAGYSAIKQSGYDERVAEESQEFKNQIADINKAHADELSKALHEAEHFRKVAVLIQTQKPKETKIYVDKIIKLNPDCTRIVGMSEFINAKRADF